MLGCVQIKKQLHLLEHCPVRTCPIHLVSEAHEEAHAFLRARSRVRSPVDKPENWYSSSCELSGTSLLPACLQRLGKCSQVHGCHQAPAETAGAV